ncbi:MAG: T9SS type A sorting domain-containing protein [Ignavibacteriales bacterium]|nr:T9SS type A sorting domain-containing protein [Ignavibacteriales bacterium]
MTAGSHSLSFNANGMPSGLYFLRVISGNFSSTIKMMLNK